MDYNFVVSFLFVYVQATLFPSHKYIDLWIFKMSKTGFKRHKVSGFPD